MNLRVDITDFANDPFFEHGYTTVSERERSDTIALFPLNDGETQADVDARVRKYLAADDLLAVCEEFLGNVQIGWLDPEILARLDAAIAKATGGIE